MSLKIKSVPQLIDLVRNERVEFKRATTVLSAFSASGACDLATTAQLTAGTGITTGTGTFYKTSVITKGNIVYTDIIIDITGLSNGHAGDIIGKADQANCHIGQITTAINGTIVGGTVTCLEVPAAGDPDIDLYCATESTGTEDTLITGLEETNLTDAGTHTVGKVSPFLSMVGTGIPDKYLYLVSGNGPTFSANLYTAGRFLIQMWGYAA
jgi:hypothetical protein